MDKLLSFLTPHLKALVAFATSWLAANQSQAAVFVTDLAGQLGVTLPGPVASALVGLAVAVVVWLVPNVKPARAKSGIRSME